MHGYTWLSQPSVFFSYTYRQTDSRFPKSDVFLEVVQNKLKSTFQSSCYCKSYTIDEAWLVHVPSAVHNTLLLSSDLWKLWELEQASRDVDSTEAVNTLLMTKELTPEL